MHKLLKRQLERSRIDHTALPFPLMQVLDAIDRAYRQADQDRSLLEHSLELTSRELVEQNQRLRAQLDEQSRTEEALRSSEERYDLAVNGADVGIWDWDLRSNSIFFSARWKALLGYGPEAISAQPAEWFQVVHPTDRALVRSAIKDHLSGHTARLDVEYRIQHKDGSMRWAQTCGMALRDESGKAYRLAGSQTDITVRKLAEERIRHDAIHDSLTGLPNRTLFMDRLNHLMARAQRSSKDRFAVLFFDLDRFKLVNDSFGHIAGDQLLIEAAQRLQACLKSSDTLARLGGDEFIVLLERIDHVEDAIAAADRLLEELKRPFDIEGHEIYTSASIGIVTNTPHHEKPEDLLRDADTAMYRAKHEGKACYQLFDTEMHRRVISRLRLENDLRKAIEQQQFELVFQPIYYLPNRRLTGFEALIRWRHPKRGLLPPAEFIPVAEEIGLIIPMDYWVLEQACAHMTRWHHTHPTPETLSINVNISARHFERNGLVQRVAQALKSTGLAPHTLQLEITETSLMSEDDSLVIQQLHDLRELGVCLYLDDFGTGYASLSYLHHLPFNGLKIDRSFVAQLGRNPQKREFIQTLLTLAESLYLFPVVEGIETEEQLAEINALSACCGQGYLFARPLPLADAEALIGIQPRLPATGTPQG